jgi:cell division control protein 6
MTQRVLITGNVGTGKTVLSQRFGLDLMKEAKDRGINLLHVHVNCREHNGSLFLILHQVIAQFYPLFPKRGYSAEELLQMLMQVLDDQNVFVILVLDELESLIRNAGSDPLYKLARIQESRINSAKRLSLICIIRETEHLNKLDQSTRSTLQRNIISLEDYSVFQMKNILDDRVNLAFIKGTVSENIVDFIANSTISEGSDARYAIELLWRSGKLADATNSLEIYPEHVRKAVSSVYPTVRKDVISSLNLHMRLLLLGLSRLFKQEKLISVSMGKAKDAYSIVCEEYNVNKRKHTQLWKYVKELSSIGIIESEPSSDGFRGKTTIISLPRISASDLENELMDSLKNGE